MDKMHAFRQPELKITCRHQSISGKWWFKWINVRTFWLGIATIWP